MRLTLSASTLVILSLSAAQAFADEPPQPLPQPSVPLPPPPPPVLLPPPAQVAPAPYPMPPMGFRVQPLEDEQRSQKGVWYGWQSLLGVIPAHLLGLYALDGGEYEEALAWLAVGGHVATAPIVHWTHGNIGRGFLSLGLNVGVPLLGLFTAFSFDEAIGLPLLVLGVIGWPALDIALLHYEDPEPSKTSQFALSSLPSRIGIRSMGVLPMFDKEKKGIAFVGQF